MFLNCPIGWLGYCWSSIFCSLAYSLGGIEKETYRLQHYGRSLNVAIICNSTHQDLKSISPALKCGLFVTCSEQQKAVEVRLGVFQAQVSRSLAAVAAGNPLGTRWTSPTRPSGQWTTMWNWHHRHSRLPSRGPRQVRTPCQKKLSWEQTREAAQWAQPKLPEFGVLYYTAIGDC